MGPIMRTGPAPPGSGKQWADYLSTDRLTKPEDRECRLARRPAKWRCQADEMILFEVFCGLRVAEFGRIFAGGFGWFIGNDD